MTTFLKSGIEGVAKRYKISLQTARKYIRRLGLIGFNPDNEHDKVVMRKVIDYSKRGYRCIPLSLIGKTPDIIAFKRGRVIAIEVGKRADRSSKLRKYRKLGIFDAVYYTAYD